MKAVLRRACVLAALLCGGVLCAQQEESQDQDIPLFNKKEPSAEQKREAIEARRKATGEYLDERIQSAVEGIEKRVGDGENAVPAAVWRGAKGFWIFDQWQAGHLITTEVCVGVGAARDARGWGNAVFYRAFDLGRGLKAGTRQARRIMLFAMTDKGRQWMDLSRWNVTEMRKQGAHILVGPRKSLPAGFDITRADVWVYDDSGDELPAGEPYPGEGTVLDNPWASQALYGLTEPPQTSKLLKESVIGSLPLPDLFREALTKAGR